MESADLKPIEVKSAEERSFAKLIAKIKLKLNIGVDIRKTISSDILNQILLRKKDLTFAGSIIHQVFLFLFQVVETKGYFEQEQYFVLVY